MSFSLDADQKCAKFLSYLRLIPHELYHTDDSMLVPLAITSNMLSTPYCE